MQVRFPTQAIFFYDDGGTTRSGAGERKVRASNCLNECFQRTGTAHGADCMEIVPHGPSNPDSNLQSPSHNSYALPINLPISGATVFGVLLACFAGSKH